MKRKRLQNCWIHLRNKCKYDKSSKICSYHCSPFTLSFLQHLKILLLWVLPIFFQLLFFNVRTNNRCILFIISVWEYYIMSVIKKKLTCHFSKRKMLEKLYLRKNKDSSMVDDDKGWRYLTSRIMCSLLEKLDF